MLSQYLLGCIYRDQGDAPESLEHFMNAVACADTTAADCDCYTLSCVYGQMAEIYTVQYFLIKQSNATMPTAAMLLKLAEWMHT